MEQQTNPEAENEQQTYDWPQLIDELNRRLHLRATPIGMKWFTTVEEMEAIPRIRRPKDIHTADQIVGQAARLNWTVGLTAKDMVGTQCSAVLGLAPQDDEWRCGKHMAGVWFKTEDDSAAHQNAMDVVPYGQYKGLAVSPHPLVSGRLDPPDICLIYATPAQMILLVNGLQWSGYQKMQWGSVGETSCEKARPAWGGGGESSTHVQYRGRREWAVERWRVSLRRFLGPGEADRRTERIHSMLCRAALWGRA